MLLEIKDLIIKYGKGVAVKGVSLNVQEGEVVSIVGANGAGKSTIIKAISGVKKPSSGEIWFQGRRIDGMPGHEIVRLGLIQVPAERMIIAPMSVIDNLKIGAYLRTDKDQINKDLENVFKHFPILKERKNQLGGQLSGGEQQMLAVGRALMANPKMLLMDEPSIGLSPILVAEVGKIIHDLNKSGLTILLVEQNCRMALKLASQAYVIEIGSIAMQGSSNELLNDARVQKYYLGG